MATTKAMTIDQLYTILGKLRRAGLGNKRILLSDDDEGNGYHEMFFGVTPPSEDMFYFGSELPFGVTLEDAMKNYVIVG